MRGNGKWSRELSGDGPGLPLSCRWHKYRSNKSSSLQEPQALVCLWWHPEPVRAPGWGQVWGTIWVTSPRADVTRCQAPNRQTPLGRTKDGNTCVTLPPAPSGVLPGVDTHPGGAKPDSGAKVGPGRAAGNIWGHSLAFVLRLPDVTTRQRVRPGAQGDAEPGCGDSPAWGHRGSWWFRLGSDPLALPLAFRDMA